jgi:hypothetical protein
MVVARVLGYLIAISGLIVLGRDGLAWHDTGRIDPVALGPLWIELWRRSYEVVEGSLASWLVIYFHRVLMLWAGPSLVVLGLVLISIARRRRRRHRRR